MSAGPTAAEVKGIVLRILSEIAPEADLSSLNPERSFRDQLDIDGRVPISVEIGFSRHLA
jgi:hypothetical protein